MMYRENIKFLELCFKCPYHKTIAKECQDKYGSYWRLLVAVSDRPIDKKIRERIHIVSADSYDELMVWCDMHSIKVESIEKLYDE